jgi:hypothetical protein
MTHDEMHEAFQALVDTMATGQPNGGWAVCNTILADQEMRDRTLPTSIGEAIYDLDGQDAPSTYGEAARHVLAMLG